MDTEEPKASETRRKNEAQAKFDEMKDEVE